jgi:hypothetical protein
MRVNKSKFDSFGATQMISYAGNVISFVPLQGVISCAATQTLVFSGDVL